jgi:hypothetical protein
MRLLVLAAAVLAAVVVPGCSEPMSRVTGKVTRGGKPVPAGVVVFFPPNSMTYTAELKPDGSYDCPAVARGRVRVAVQLPLPTVAPRPTPPPKAKSDGGKSAAEDDQGKKARSAPTAPTAPPDTATFTDAPKFADPNTSGLAFDLTAPEFKFDIDLK